MASNDQPLFFKVICAHTLQNKMLAIPKKISREHAEALSGPAVFLELPTGLKWRIELTWKDGKVWFDKWWHEFAFFCDIQEDYFLFFRHVGDSCFHTLIFDKTKTEIDYPKKDYETESNTASTPLIDHDDDLVVPLDKE